MEEIYKTFTVLIARCHRAIKRIKSEGMLEYNLKGLHVSCLYTLYNSKTPLTFKELGVACDEDKGSISRAVDQLEKKEFVKCNSKTKKRYNCPIELTEKGIILAKSLEKKINDVIAMANPGIDEEKREMFYEYLTIIANNLDKISERYEGEKDNEKN